jgi:hypothetical protein
MGPSRRLGLVLLAIASSNCGGSSSSSPQAIPPGEWGTLGVEMMAGSSGAALTFCCSTGQIPPPLTLDPEGNFDLQGTLTLTGGPVPVDGFKPEQARYTGSVNGNTLNLTVSSPGQNASYVLTFGKPNTALCVCPL